MAQERSHDTVEFPRYGVYERWQFADITAKPSTFEDLRPDLQWMAGLHAPTNCGFTGRSWVEVRVGNAVERRVVYDKKMFNVDLIKLMIEGHMGRNNVRPGKWGYAWGIVNMHVTWVREYEPLAFQTPPDMKQNIPEEERTK